jgi:hypothetical protein
MLYRKLRTVQNILDPPPGGTCGAEKKARALDSGAWSAAAWWAPRARRPSAALGSGASSARRRDDMVALPGTTGAAFRRPGGGIALWREDNGDNGGGPGDGGDGRVQGFGEQVTLKDGPAESGESPAPGAASGTAIMDRSPRGTRPTRQMPRRRRWPSARRTRGRRTAGTAQAPAEEARVVGRPRRGAELLRRVESAGDGRGAEPCVGKKTPALCGTMLPLGEALLRAEGHASALFHRVANNPGPCSFRPRAFARHASQRRAGAQPLKFVRRLLHIEGFCGAQRGKYRSVREPTPTGVTQRGFTT